MRLDQFLHQQFPKISRAQLQRLVRDGRATVNKVVRTKSGFEVRETDKINLDLNFESTKSTDLNIPVIYEDIDCVVIDKPVGVLTHSKGEFNPETTAASWLVKRPGFKFKQEEGNLRSGIVHRLDRATSGVMIMAKNPQALRHLQKQFQDRKAKKTYIARVAGRVNPKEALIDLPIERNPKQPQRFRVGKQGKAAQTYYKTLDEVHNKTGVDSILELKPVTGRTHQLRVHLNYIKHPIIGDTFYDGPKADRLYLHARQLEITLPNSERRIFEAPLPETFAQERR